MECTRVDLEKLAQDKKLAGKHADYLIIAGDTAIIVEETSNPKMDDVDKLDNTVNQLLHGPLREYLPPQHTPQKIIAVIHKHARADSMVPRTLMRRTRDNTIYDIVNCKRDLKEILRRYC